MNDYKMDIESVNIVIQTFAETHYYAQESDMDRIEEEFDSRGLRIINGNNYIYLDEHAKKIILGRIIIEVEDMNDDDNFHIKLLERGSICIAGFSDMNLLMDAIVDEAARIALVKFRQYRGVS